MQLISVLATDMDGTFIPLDGNQQNRRDLATLCSELEQRGIELVYVTGRHYELVLDAIGSHALPAPQWMICDVGTSIYQRTSQGDHQLLQAYQQNLARIVGSFGVEALAQALSDTSQLRIQEPEKQGPYKLSYYCEASSLPQITEQVGQLIDRLAAPYRVIASVDPFTGEGLIDFLPQGVSKEYALRWWVDHTAASSRKSSLLGIPAMMWPP